jgi:16S rRNA (guanine966-N2)-methyltransferase
MPVRKPARNHPSTPPVLAAGRQSVRIVGGAWRGRRLPFPVVEGLRPTPDRLRETLFNWLQGKLAGATVLDLFAGSGALGLEALSRGATAATLVERHPAAAKQLRESVATLCGGAAAAASGPARATVLQADGYQYLLGAVTAYDGVFLDPPFADERETELCKLLSSRGWLATGSWVYVERAAARPAPVLPIGFTLWREGRAGDVGCQLLRWEPPTP